MSELSTQPAVLSARQEFIKTSIPAWLTSAPENRRIALKNVDVSIPAWYRSAPPGSHQALKHAIERSWLAQSRVDRLFEGLADVAQFAEPILHEALKTHFAVELDVKKTCLRLYTAKGLAKGYTTRTISLLEAALYNFEAKEAAAGYFDRASCFITAPDGSGQFEMQKVPSRLSIAAFASLCRQLDIGGRYQQQLNALLLPTDAAAKAMLARRVIACQQERLRVAILLARMKGDIAEGAQAALLELLNGVHRPVLAGKVLRCHSLSMLDAPLTGVVLFSADLEHSGDIEPIIAYVPDDPEHPLKAYASTAEFATELALELRSPGYQRFFSRFVAHEHRGAFFAGLGTLATLHRHPSVRAHVIGGEFWAGSYRNQLDRILNDARVMAVSTADEDRLSRWQRWDSLQRVAGIVIEVATLAIVPFVPFLGELMLAYAAYQLLDDAFTGILDWSEGQLIEASGHLLSIAQNVAQMGAFVVGGMVIGKVLPIRSSGFVESLKFVDTGTGRTRLWNPDLTPYQRAQRLPVDSQPDALGLHQDQAVRVLPLDGTTYEVTSEPDAENYRIRHPHRADAYQPRLSHNGAGAWAHEVEQPMAWQGAQLFRRLGHSVAGFSDVTAARILAVSGIDEAVLRDLHVHARRPPALLEDSIGRFTLDQQIQAFIAQLQSPDPRLWIKADPQMQAHLLKARGVNVAQLQTGNGNLLQRVVETLEGASLKRLLGDSHAFGDPLPGLEVRAARLRARMAEWAEQNRADLFKAVEALSESSDDEGVLQLRRTFPGLPKAIALELWRNTAASERLRLHNQLGISKPLAQEALFYLREVRLSRACEGLYLDAVSNPDSDRLALHMLETLPGWSADVRIEVRDGDFNGGLLDSIGHPDSATRKILVKQQGQYLACDGAGEQLHGLDTLYGAVQHALEDAQRQALGLPDTWQGADLKQTLRRQPLPSRPMLRALFGQPLLEPGGRSPMRLAVGRSGYLQGGGDFKPVQALSVEQRFRALYPTVPEEELATLRSELLSADPLLAVARLENQHLTLVNDLELWCIDVPARHPATGSLLSEHDIVTQRQQRRLFAQALQANWSRTLTAANPHTATAFEFDVDFLGALPELSADFSHVRELSLSSDSSRATGHGFFASFPGVRYLFVSGLALETLPVELYQMRELVTLTLDNCGIRLSEASVEGLAHMEKLTLLDLDGNPLGISPDVRYMKMLDSLYLKNTGLVETPVGLFELDSLAFADLQANRITRLPDELFEVSDEQEVNYSFLNNPLDDFSRRRLYAYFNRAGLDKKILIQFDGAELEVESDVEVETESDDSGVAEDSDGN
jgi:hypothetical protein